MSYGWIGIIHLNRLAVQICPQFTRDVLLSVDIMQMQPCAVLRDFVIACLFSKLLFSTLKYVNTQRTGLVPCAEEYEGLSRFHSL